MLNKTFEGDWTLTLTLRFPPKLKGSHRTILLKGDKYWERSP